MTCHAMSNSNRRGFSLVELVIVILILGILAAVAAPRMMDQTARAREHGTRQSLAVVRNCIELYRAETGALPTGDEAAFKTALRAYLQGPFPRAEVGNPGDTVRIVTTSDPLTPSGTQSWAYSSASGEFIVNHAAGVNW